MTPTNDAPVTVDDLTRPIIGIENRTAQEAFDIMADRIRSRLAALASAPDGVNITVRQKTPVVADYGDNFLVAQVSADGKTVGIDHPCDAVWSDVDRAQTALRDYINERIAGQDKCPFKPRGVASAPAGDAFGAIVLIDGKRPDWVRDDDRLLMRRKATGQWAERSWYGFNWNDFDAIRALADHPHYAADLARPHSAVAPAGDGYGKWHPMLLDLVNAIHGDRGEKTQAIGIDLSYQQALAAALARPRAAVGEQNREAIARLIWNDRHPTGASWDDWERHIAANGGFDGRDSCRRLADRILALQSPPAKVEG